METKKVELDVDFIGGEGSLTNAEEKALSDYFSKRKVAREKLIDTQKLRTAKRPKTAV